MAINSDLMYYGRNTFRSLNRFVPHDGVSTCIVSIFMKQYKMQKKIYGMDIFMQQLKTTVRDHDKSKRWSGDKYLWQKVSTKRQLMQYKLSAIHTWVANKNRHEPKPVANASKCIRACTMRSRRQTFLICGSQTVDSFTVINLWSLFWATIWC